jgi:fibronectin type 3 domain-containing protein
VRKYPACGGGLDTQPPTVPQGLSGQATSGTQIALTWTGSTDNGGGTVAGYRIYRNGTALATTAATNYTDSTVSPDTTYSYRVAAYDNAQPANESLQSSPVPVTTPTQVPTTVIRVNSGGPQYTDSLNQVWAADTGFNTGSTVSVANAIAGTADPALYRTERWDPGTAPELAYAFTVPNGSYTVKLHFAETWSGGQGVGKRVFDVFLENQLVLDNLDIFAEVGGFTALVKTFQVNVTDGQLNISFAHGSADDPQIGAIEILGFGGAPPPDTQPPTVPQNLGGSAPNSSQVTLNWTGSTDNGGGSVAGYRIFRNGTSLTTTTATTYTDSTVTPSTTYTYRVAAFDNASPANQSAQSNQVSVTTPGAPTTVIRVNSGGPQYTDSANQVWAADTGFNTGSTVSVTNAIAGTSDPALYRTERWDPGTAPELAYAFTVPNGTYTVKLHFAETWSGGQAVGKRVFDVFLENQLVLDNLDIFAQVGGYTALIKTFQVSVTDGQLNISFAHGSADDPQIGAIEILSNGAPPPDTQPPTIPQNPSAQAVNASQVTLSWLASTDNGGGAVAGYRIFRNDVALTTTTATTYVDNTVLPSTTYTYRVSAFDNASPANESAQSPQATVTTPAAVTTVIRVNAGGPQYTDSANQVWAADTGFNTGSTVNVANAIAGTSDPALYRTERWDPGTAPELAYAFNVPNGTYTVKLHFCETWSGGQGVGKRVFDVFLENQLVLDNLDIFAQVGGYTALVKTFQVTVNDGQLNLNFAHGSADDPQIGAIEILSN